MISQSREIISIVRPSALHFLPLTSTTLLNVLLHAPPLLQSWRLSQSTQCLVNQLKLLPMLLRLSSRLPYLFYCR